MFITQANEAEIFITETRRGLRHQNELLQKERFNSFTGCEELTHVKVVSSYKNCHSINIYGSFSCYCVAYRSIF